MPYKDPEVRRIKQQAYQEAHREMYRAAQVKHRELHPENVKKSQYNWKLNNRTHLSEYQRQHRKNNPELYRQYEVTKLTKYAEKISQRRKESHKYRMENDLHYRIAITSRNRIRVAVKAQYSRKSAKTLELLGCTVEELKQYLEKSFYKHSKTDEMMTWDNYGFYGWHIDHIIPCAKFDLINFEEQKKCFHYTNLQPLWRHENLSKGAK